jgi:hypothetical protein
MFRRFVTIHRFPTLASGVTSDAVAGTNSRTDRGVRRALRRRPFIVAAGLMVLMLTFILPGMAVGAQSVYPPNTVISTYFDARYGEVSVVTDASGNLIDVNAATGQRIYPVYADDTSVYNGAYVAPAYVNANSFSYTGIATYSGSAVFRQYTDNNSNCTDGQVTQTASGYYCTATSTPAYRVS